MSTNYSGYALSGNFVTACMKTNLCTDYWIDAFGINDGSFELLVLASETDIVVCCLVGNAYFSAVEI